MQKQLNNLEGVKWVGDLSLQDADIIAYYSKQSTWALEHGSGGSTMIMSHFCNVISFEHDDKWKHTVRKRLDLISNKKITHVLNEQQFYNHLRNNHYQFDLMFVDGRVIDRRPFIDGYWNQLIDGGYLLIHDTRKIVSKHTFERHIHRTDLIPNDIINMFPNEIGEVYFNKKDSNGVASNITAIKKEVQPLYDNWQDKENKPSWAYGSDTNVIDMLWEYKS